jgi:hypothetical protein
VSWVADLFRSRKARKVVKELAPIALHMLTRDKSLRELAESNQDEAFDQAVKFAAKASGLDIDAEELRLTICEVALSRTRQKLLREQARHEAEMLRIKERYGR